MRKCFKNTWLSICLLASVAMVGCGGGGGGGGAYVPSNTQAPEAQTAQSAVTQSVVPVVNNVSSILNGVPASYRTSITNNQEVFSVTDTNNSVVAAMKAPNLLRAVLRASGGAIEDGLFMGEDSIMQPNISGNYYGFIEVASFSNNVYERTLYYIPNEPPANENEVVLATAAQYLINGCKCELDGTTLKSLTFNSNAKISIEEFTREGKTKNLIKGTIDTDLSLVYNKEEKENLSDTVIDFSGNKINITNENGYYWGFKATKKITSKITYSLNKPIVLKINNYFGTHDVYDYIFFWNSESPNTTKELTRNEYSSNIINVTISGITGTITTANTTYFGDYANYNSNTKKWETYNYSENDIYLTFTEKPAANLKYASTCEVSINGALTDTESYGQTNYLVGNGVAYDSPTFENPKTTPTAKRSVTVNTVNVKLRNVSGDLDKIVVGDAEAHVQISNFSSDEVLKIGDHEVAFNSAKIDVTSLKYNYSWEPKSDKYSIIQDPNGYWWGMTDNEEYLKEVKERDKKCFGNAIVKISASESKNNVDITANCDINKKTATAHLVNNGNTYKLKDDVTEFDFRTLDINATKVDVLADNNCEGAELVVTCVEKNNSTTKRNYKVVNGKLVRSDLPQEVAVDVPTEIQEVNSNKIESEIAELPAEELKPVETKDGSELKVAKKDGKSIATYNKGKETDKVKVQTNIIAMTNTIFATSFFTDNDKIYTILFVIENKNGKKLINGSIFSGKQPGLDSRDRYNGDFAKFNCSDGKKLSVLPIKGTAFDISLP